MKALHLVIMGIDVDPNSIVEKSKYLTKMDEFFELQWYSTYMDILYHIDVEKTRNGINPRYLSFLEVRLYAKPPIRDRAPQYKPS